MKLKRAVSMLLTSVMLLSVAAPAPAAAAEPVNLVPDEMSAETGNYVCTWNIQDWVAWHEKKGGQSDGNKRDVVDPEHLFNEKNGWVSTMYPESRGDLIFLLDDAWDLPYGTQKSSGEGRKYFGGMVMQSDKFPDDEYGKTPQEKLKTLNEKIKSYGWKGTGLWVAAQQSSVYANSNDEEYWKERIEWSKYAGIVYWKIDWGDWRQTSIEWRRNISEWAEEIYPELMIEHIVGGTNGKSDSKDDYRISQSKIQESIEFAAFSDVWRTYDVVDQLMIPLTLDRAGEQLMYGFTEKGNAMGLINAEDEMYICASLGFSSGVMRFAPTLADDTAKSGDGYYGIGTEKDHYFAGGKRFADTRSTRRSLNEVDRMVRWHRIAPPYTVGAYDTVLANEYFKDEWNFTGSEKGWDGTSSTYYQKAPAVIARGIDMPTVTVDSGDKPYMTASRNPSGAISIATFGRTKANKGYQPVKTAKVSLNAGDLTGFVGVFGHYGELKLTFNQDLTGKKVLAQDLLADEARDITNHSQVKINGKTITIGGDLLREIGLSAQSEGDRSEPGLVIQIGETKDFVDSPKINERMERWELNNNSFERFNYDGSKGETIKSVTGVDWNRSGNTGNSFVNEEGHTGSYSGIHRSVSGDYEVATYQENLGVENGVYKATCYVKASNHSRKKSGGTSAGFYVKNHGSSEQYVDIQKMGELKEWTKIEIPKFTVTSGTFQIEFYSYGAKNEYLMFDDVQIERIGDAAKVNDVAPIFEMDFSDKNGNTVYGVANGQKISATAQNITFKTDDDGNDVAVFPEGDSTTGITYTPGDSDPMKNLKKGAGATISMWIKTKGGNFNQQLFAYGALQTSGEYKGNLGASAQILARNNNKNDGVVFYRNQSGKTQNQKASQSTASPYRKDTWQMVTYVENGDGTGTFYVDGVALGNCPGDKTLYSFATDGNKPDSYYIGFLPYDTDDSHFTGEIDSVTVYNGAMSEGQVQNLYKARTTEQTEITLYADGNGVLGGQAVEHFTPGQGYVGWIGKSSGAEEGTVTFSFDVKQAGDWVVDVDYLSEAGNSSNNRDIVITANADIGSAITKNCPAGSSWDDPSLASTIAVGKISLKKGRNTLKIGNPNGDAPSLVKVVLTRGDVAEAAEVEALILGNLGTVDDFSMRETVEKISARYDALTDAQKAMVSEEARTMLTKAKIFMGMEGGSSGGATAEPSEPTKPDTSTEVTAPIAPSESENPSTPSTSENPSAPSDPVVPSDPIVPSDPAEPSIPIDPSVPSVPSEESTPSEPGAPSVPSEESTPSSPSEESAPSVPSEASRPGEPSAPSQSAAPSQPSEPSQSIAPSQPTAPVAPVLSAQERKMADLFGVTPEVAKEIAAVVDLHKVSEATLKINEQALFELQNDKDVAGSSFAAIQAKVAKQTKNSVKLKWNKVSGADGYVIMGNLCGGGNPYETITTVTGTSYTHKKLEKGTYYKYIVYAYKDVAGAKVTLAASKTIHTATKGGKFRTVKSVKVKSTNVKLSVGKTYKLAGKEVNADKKIKLHRKIAYETTNPAVATVAKNGKMRATGRGKCYIYAYAQNGMFKKVKVTVK